MANTMKLVEEVGELNAEILGHLKLQRKEKLAKFTPETLQDEFGDTIISTLRLARIMGIDVQ
jgi:NTP pyrophosphatase (non-canonical NTP hydrolase)